MPPRIPLPALFAGLLTVTLAAPLAAQEPPATPPATPQVKVNMLNVCTPSADEQKEIAAALARIPKQPLFSADFEVSRGRSTLTDMPSFLAAGQPGHVAGEPSVASYVRIRREFSVQALFASVQYSFSNDGANMVETLVLHVRDPKDLIQVAIEDSASSVTSSDAMLASNTPANRVRLERFGKSSIALARCSAADSGAAIDQSAYEPLFRSASDVLANYRALLNVKKIVPEELAAINESKPKAATKPTPAKPTGTKK
ncbi:MAG TPA: hypothetical protein VKF84_07115 [Candidatus Sulfotelmatobacter sp.]|nr:hypothetical protein [Candidatus Sulfotelmatobacter sp.]